MANDFSADSNCISVYRFEDGAVNTDSKGTNTLSEYGSPSTSLVVFDEGAASSETAASCRYRTDANLSSNFPLKSGTANKTISVFARVRLNFSNSGNAPVVMAKQNNVTGSHRTITCDVLDSTGNMFPRLRIGSSTGGYAETVSHGTSLSNTTWYRICWSYQDSTKAYAIRVRNASGNVVGTDLTGTSTTDGIALFSQSDFIIGGRQAFITPPDTFWTGWLDEMVIFNKILTATDVTNLANGTYSGTGDGGGPLVSANDTATVTEDVRMHMPIYVPMMKL